jgi:hypothetical protein
MVLIYAKNNKITLNKSVFKKKRRNEDNEPETNVCPYHFSLVSLISDVRDYTVQEFVLTVRICLSLCMLPGQGGSPDSSWTHSWQAARY